MTDPQKPTHTCDHHCTHGGSDAQREELSAAMGSLLTNDRKAHAKTLPEHLINETSARAAIAQQRDNRVQHHYLPASPQTIVWGYFARSGQPALHIDSGDFVTIETLTHHAYDDYERMIQGDPGAESVFHWTKDQKNIRKRGMGPDDHPLGAGGGLGVHLLTGPVHINGAEPGDVLEVRILDVTLRPSANPLYKGRSFGVNAAAWWGFQYGDCVEEPKKREVVTVYEVDATGQRNWAQAAYSFRWVPQTDPDGVVHHTIDYPGVPVDHSKIHKNHDFLKGIRVPIRPHFGLLGVAPAEAETASTNPPSYHGGNVDNWRMGKGATVYYPVAVAGALFSAGDPHASQGDAELCGTAIECSLTGTFQLILHKKSALPGTPLEGLSSPLLETADEWIVHGFSYPNYLKQLGDEAETLIFQKSSLDLAMRDAYHKMRDFLMTTQRLSEDEAISLISVASDFGVTQVVDGNWGVHASIRKQIFPNHTG